MESAAVYCTGASMPFLRWRFRESARSESSMALLCIQMALCSESMLAVSGNRESGRSVSGRMESEGMESGCSVSRRTEPGRMESGSKESMRSESMAFDTLGKRRRGTSAITKTMTKSIRNMSVFLRTAAKVLNLAHRDAGNLTFFYFFILLFLYFYSNRAAHARNLRTPASPNFSNDWAASATVRTRSGLDFE